MAETTTSIAYSPSRGEFVYIFNQGYQSETIDYYLGDDAARSNIYLNFSGYELADLQLRRDGFDLVVKTNDSDEEITLKGYYQDYSDVGGYTPVTGLGAPYSTLATVTIQGSKVSDLAPQIENLEGEMLSHGTSGPDLLIGGTGANILVGWSGDDQIYGLDDNDILFGMSGNDTLYGNTGDDVIYGGSGHDTIYGGSGDDTLYGGAGNDVLEGGKGNDGLYGGSGKDVYRFGQDHGADTIADTGTLSNPSTLDLDAVPKHISRTDSDLVLHTSDQDKIIIQDYFTSSNHIEIRVGDTVVLSASDMNTIAQDLVVSTTLYGTDGDDSLSGDVSRSNEIHGLGGNDTIYGGDHRDFLLGEDGNDTIYGRGGDDYLVGGYGADTLYGGDGNDLLVGGNGSDTLEGGEGIDTYLFSSGHGKDVVIDSATGSLPNVLRFDGATTTGSGVYSDMSIFSRSEDDLVIYTEYADRSTGEVTVSNYFNQPAAFKLVFDDAAIDSYDELLSYNSDLAYYDADGGISASSATTALEQQNTQAVI